MGGGGAVQWFAKRLTHERDDGRAEALPVPLLEEVLRGHGQHRVLRLDKLLDGVGERRQVFARDLERVDICSPNVGFCFVWQSHAKRRSLGTCAKKGSLNAHTSSSEYTLWLEFFFFSCFSSGERRSC